MNKIYQLVLPFLLLFIFSTKVVLPSVLSQPILQEEKMETDEKEAFEKTTKFKEETESLSFQIIPQVITLVKGSCLHYSHHSFLPVQYFTIPTPPPWQKGECNPFFYS